MHILHVVGARPNFMKASPVMGALERWDGVNQTLIHTGQHYDRNMSELFFEQLELREPDFNLNVGSGSHAEQTANVMLCLERVVLEQKPNLVLVYGDVNSTLAAALVCAKLGISLGHVEAGLRSRDRSMPEEINRILTDQVADLLFTPSADADANLLAEGVPPEKIHCVGNVMIDTLIHLLPQASQSEVLKKLNLLNEHRQPISYVLVTLHRPSNVDDPETLSRLIAALQDISARLPVVFPMHPRTSNRLVKAGLVPERGKVQMVEPLGYLDFICLQCHATVVVTDSGGIQEESTYLGVPCLTMRDTTERPITVTMGTNQLIDQDTDKLVRQVECILAGQKKKGSIPPLWDGHASDRIATIIETWWHGESPTR